MSPKPTACGAELSEINTFRVPYFPVWPLFSVAYSQFRPVQEPVQGVFLPVQPEHLAPFVRWHLVAYSAYYYVDHYARIAYSSLMDAEGSYLTKVLQRYVKNRYDAGYALPSGTGEMSLKDATTYALANSDMGLDFLAFERSGNR